MRPPYSTSIFSKPRAFWMPRRETAFNWLALGLLLAAWNAADNDDVVSARRPEALRAYPFVSARALQRMQARSQ